MNTTTQTATSWQWTLIRQPATSAAALSSTSIRNPVFTPDVPDLYIFQLVASNGVNTSITRVSFDRDGRASGRSPSPTTRGTSLAVTGSEQPTLAKRLEVP